MELAWKNITLRECDIKSMPPIPTDDEGFTLDPQAGPVNSPINFAIILGGEYIGNCAIYNPEDDEVELGIWITAAYRNKGYGSEALKILSDYYLLTLGFSRIHLKVLPYNGRAIRAYRKAGFTQRGKIVVDSIEFLKMDKIKGG